MLGRKVTTGKSSQWLLNSLWTTCTSFQFTGVLRCWFGGIKIYGIRISEDCSHFKYDFPPLLPFMYAGVWELLAEDLWGRLHSSGKWGLRLVLKDGKEQERPAGRRGARHRGRGMDKARTGGSKKSNLDGANGASWGMWTRRPERTTETRGRKPNSCLLLKNVFDKMDMDLIFICNTLS